MRRATQAFDVFRRLAVEDSPCWSVEETYFRQLAASELAFFLKQLNEFKHALMERLGKKALRIELSEAIQAVPGGLAEFDLALSKDGQSPQASITPHSHKKTREDHNSVILPRFDDS